MEELYLFRKELQNLGYCKTVVSSYPKQVAKFLNHTRKVYFEIQPSDIATYYSYLQTIQSPRTGKLLSESYIHSILLAIKLYFEYLQRAGQRKDNPYQVKIKSPKSEERKVFTKEEIQKLYSKSNPLQTIILHLCYACGLRRNEAAELSIKDIDLVSCLLYIRKGKGKKRRVIPFTKQVQQDFKSYIDVKHKMQDNRKLLNITAVRIYKEFKNLLKKTELANKGFVLHCLRHTIATQLLEQGMELEKVRDFLGHEYLSTTQIYTRINYGTGKLSEE
ncbi:hypothetical protein EG339_21740 [Chryseobacterium bernardetii]|uniref:Tyr recombinase domain-containing protein n=1 Tax=Chryseobacterium bernardetii TaxID=1241978 RepID=A0A3G6TLS2_9FLAO|nr:tyrosine-type recombinase/integrase [Chryseobacterium bernardetii]AZB27020.1 hypothetical protein EG339_21740 [Chryseobacterium bernardetii]